MIFRLVVISFSLLLLASCDCTQRADGIVVDKYTRLPIEGVALGKYEKEDSDNPYTRRDYTGENGIFKYSSISGGLFGCPDLVLYFSHKQYQTTKRVMHYWTINDTVLLELKKFDPDISPKISIQKFNALVDTCIQQLKTRELQNITPIKHVKIMLTLNTIFMKRLKGGRYESLESLANKKNYTTEIIKIFPDWIPNRGMGFYFTKLRMELYGTPRPYAVYKVIGW